MRSEGIVILIGNAKIIFFVAYIYPLKTIDTAIYIAVFCQYVGLSRGENYSINVVCYIYFAGYLINVEYRY